MRPPGEKHSRFLRFGVTSSMLLGAALVAGSGAIHLHLWMSGYRAIDVIGPMFLAQAVCAFVIAVAIAALRRATLALAGVALLAGTIAGLLTSVWHGVFGFQDSFGAPYAGLSLCVEGAGIVVLASAAFGCDRLRRGH